MERKKILKVASVLLIIATLVFSSTAVIGEDRNDQDDFILPSWGGGMVHCDPQLTDNIRLPVPIADATKNVGEVWYCNSVGGELHGTLGIGVSGNGRIAACTFNNPAQDDNLIIYDYYGNRLWTSGQWLPLGLSEFPWSLNSFACSSTPMVDIYDHVIACDNEKIIYVNAADHANIHVEWIHTFSSGGIPFSPTIVMNKIIIVPTRGGPLYAFDVSNGEELATLFFQDNSDGGSSVFIPEMDAASYSSILSNPSVSPYHYNRNSHVVEWNSTVPYGIMPLAPTFYENNVMFTTDQQGVVTAIDMEDGAILAINALGNPEVETEEKLYSTVNSACVQGNRVFVTTQYPLSGGNDDDIYGRLYAVDVNPDAQTEEEILTIAWYFSFPGRSQASPTLIGDTIYFDGYNGTTSCFVPPPNRDNHIYAVYTDGTLRWKQYYKNITAFSFSMDPRGGFWYEDIGLPTFGGGGRKLVHFDENGDEIESIDMKTLIGDESIFNVYPCSCMTICGTAIQPIMLISANHFLCIPGKWVAAIDLSDNNRLLWKVPLEEGPFHFNTAGGQYVILMENDDPRIVFETTFGGVMAIGKRSPDCWFDTISSTPLNSQNYNPYYYDSINVALSIQTSVLQDLWIKAMIVSESYPNLCFSTTEKNYQVTSSDIEDNLTLVLPPNALEGMYRLKLYLYNSTGIIERKLLTLPDYVDNGIYTNDTYISQEYFLQPSIN